jgi:hypothetical protein
MKVRGKRTTLLHSLEKALVDIRRCAVEVLPSFHPHRLDIEMSCRRGTHHITSSS